MRCLLCGRDGGGPLDDAEILALARAGDLDAYGLLVDRHGLLAHRTAVLMGAGDDADDVVQEAFVRAYRGLSGLRADAPFRPWLLAIVANQTRNLHRSRRRRDGLVLRAAAHEPAGSAGDAPGEAAVAAERRAVLVRALRGLDERDREVLVLRYLLDLSEAETAQVLGLARGTVKSRTHRALARLRGLVAPGPAQEARHG
jgi:RNA polymerase sigma factor (sigma-70 family)